MTSWAGELPIIIDEPPEVWRRIIYDLTVMGISFTPVDDECILFVWSSQTIQYQELTIRARSRNLMPDFPTRKHARNTSFDCDGRMVLSALSAKLLANHGIPPVVCFIAEHVRDRLL